MNNEYNFALVKNGLVVTVIVFDSPNPDNDLLEVIKKDLSVDQVIRCDEGGCNPGYRWDGEKFLEPFAVDKTSIEE